MWIRNVWRTPIVQSYWRVEISGEFSQLQSIVFGNKPYTIEVPEAFYNGLLNRFEVAEVFERERIYD